MLGLNIHVKDTSKVVTKSKKAFVLKMIFTATNRNYLTRRRISYQKDIRRYKKVFCNIS